MTTEAAIAEQPDASRPTLAGRVLAWLPLVGTIVMTLAFAVHVNLPALASDAVFADDAGQHTWWAQRAWNSDPTAHDEIARLFESDAMAPVGYRLSLRALANIGEIQKVTELSMLGLLAATAAMLYVLGRRVAGTSWGGFVLLAVYFGRAMIGDSPLSSGLLQRDWAPLTLAMGLYGLVSRRLWVVGVAGVLAVLFYPITLAVLGLTAVTHEAWRLYRDRKLPSGWWVAALLGVVALGLMVLRDVPDLYGSRVTAAESAEMQIFKPGGRNAYWFSKEPIRFFFYHHRSGFDQTPTDLAKSFGVLGLLAVLGWRRSPLAAWLMIAASLLLFVAAHAVAFSLYLPNRHVAIPLPLAQATLIAAMLPATVAGLGRLARWPESLRGPRLRLAAGVIAIALPIVLLWPQLRGGVETTRAWMAKENEGLPLRTYLRGTPPDTIVAGHPRGMNFLPLRTGRPVLANLETLNPYYPKVYHELILPRAEASIRAYFARDWADVDRLYDEYGATVYLFTGGYLKPPRRNIEPIGRLDDRYRGDVETDPPVMVDPPADRVLFRDESLGVTLIRVGPGPAGTTTPASQPR